MAIGVHSRAFHQHQDPTSAPTSKQAHGGHIEVLAAKDKQPSMRQNVGMPRGKTLRERTLANKGEGI